MAEKVVYKFPKTLGACADRLYNLRARRMEEQKKVDVIGDEEKALKQHIIDTLPKSHASGVAGRVARVSVVTKIVPQVDDWPALYKYISRTKSWDLLQRRVSPPAVKARWDDHKAVPGVGEFTVVDVSINKL